MTRAAHILVVDDEVNIRTMMITPGTSIQQIERQVIERTLKEVTNHRENAAQL